LPRNFNPRSHAGSDAGSESKLLFNRDFNPRSHAGSDSKNDQKLCSNHEYFSHFFFFIPKDNQSYDIFCFLQRFFTIFTVRKLQHFMFA
ncbi:MAG: hypothetical protein PHC92_12240, partial [Syntrophomonadaceae bacterium]|nr:hypothetical protein [Syntrophomonadaceae bacterium]